VNLAGSGRNLIRHQMEVHRRSWVGLAGRGNRRTVSGEKGQVHSDFEAHPRQVIANTRLLINFEACARGLQPVVNRPPACVKEGAHEKSYQRTNGCLTANDPSRCAKTANDEPAAMTATAPPQTSMGPAPGGDFSLTDHTSAIRPTFMWSINRERLSRASNILTEPR
jgi:hypothetical protein